MPKPATGLNPKQIDIYKGNPSGVNQSSVDVSKKNRDKVRWVYRGDWLVVFDSPSPFERDYFDPAHPGNTDIVVEPSDHEYKYTVYVDGIKGADPIIIVHP